MVDRRDAERVTVDTRVEVFDRNSGAMMGVLMDLSPVGFMLNTPRPPPLNNLYQLCLQLADGEEQRCQLDVGAEALWREDAEDGSHAWVGFRIIDLSDEDAQFIEQMVARWQAP